MPPAPDAIRRLTEALYLTTPLIAVYDARPQDIPGSVIPARARVCVFAFYPRWLNGASVAFQRGEGGCMGAHRAYGLEREYPPWMAHFLTDGVDAPKGEGLKVNASTAQAFLDQAKAPPVTGDSVVIGPLHLVAWDRVRSVSFLADPDRLAALATLAAWWSPDTRLVQAPFSSGCGHMWREVIADDRPILGGTDLAMRRYLPADTLLFSVSPARFEQMLSFPEDCFLRLAWWAELARARGWTLPT